LVTGGGGAHAYPIERAPDDPFQSKQINYHYLLVEVDRQQVKVTMNRLDLTTGKAVWTQPDSVTITVTKALAQVRYGGKPGTKLDSLPRDGKSRTDDLHIRQMLAGLVFSC
jgi:hypothetical protein